MNPFYVMHIHTGTRYIALAMIHEGGIGGFSVNLEGRDNHSSLLRYPAFQGNINPNPVRVYSARLLVGSADRNMREALKVFDSSELQFDGFVPTCVMCGKASVNMDEPSSPA